jgi:hypothetical protein
MLHKNRNHRSRSIPYERCVAADRPAACSSAKNADTASTLCPSGPKSRQGAQRSPVAANEPAWETTKAARSRGAAVFLPISTAPAPSPPGITGSPGPIKVSPQRRPGRPDRCCSRDNGAGPVDAGAASRAAISTQV